VSDTTYVARDARTMLRRNLRHALRYPSMTISVVAVPLVMLLLFNGVYGKTLGHGISGLTMSGADYVGYVTPGILIMAATAGSIATSVSVAVDKTQGIVNRFRVMAVSRAAFLTGHVVCGVIQTMVAVLIMLVAALATGFRPHGNALAWLAAIGLLALLATALSWLSAALGLVAKTVESSSNSPMPLQFLPLLGSSIVPAGAMPAGLSEFAKYQPFTPMTETLRGLLTGGRIGTNGLTAVAWCVGLGLVGYLWAVRAFYRNVTTTP
jgi:ABC-2 type transport system permease protein